MINIQLPPIQEELYSKDGNCIYKFYEKVELISNCEFISNNPFLIKSENIYYFFTSDEGVEIPAAYNYALLTSKKPNKQDFENEGLKIKRWLKHPKFQVISPSEIVHSWKNKFKFIKEDLDQNIKGLRSPQIGAIYSILSHVQNADDIGIVVMPTGTGKTETMLCTLIANQCKKLLVAVPSVSLRTQLSDKFISLGLLKEFGIVDSSCHNPIVGVLNTKFQDLASLSEFISKVNVVVTTMNILTGSSSEAKDLLSAEFSHLFVDEAHHSEASTWKNFIEKFHKEKIFLFTATPFRNDGKKLNGKFIFNFSLRKAQEQKYYKRINYLPIREYNKKKADEMIASKAVQKLREDIANEYNHIIMARCRTQDRAIEVFEYYKQYEDLNPIVIYTGVSGLTNKINAIKRREHRIIVCVNMLGEGFDLPELKIAAIHDERQSLPITLQFIGRFTRSSYDQLGEASFITNLAYPPIKEELDQLYAKDTDWNLLLPSISEGATQKEIDFKEFLDGFNHLDRSNIPFQSIIPAMSTIIYKNGTNEWNPNNWQNGISNLYSYSHQYSDHNPHTNTLVIILGKVTKVDWGDFDTVQNMEWDLIVIFWDYRPNVNRIFINSSIKGLSTDKLVTSIFGDENSMIKGMDVFKIFHDVHRLSLYNVGARKGTGKDISFQSFFGRGVQDGLKLLEQGTLIKNNIFGVGYKEGNKVSLGCSIKGKIWSYLRGNINELTEWCEMIGEIVEDPNIDPNTVLKNTLVPITIYQKPQETPIAVEWHPEMFMHTEDRYEIIVNGNHYDLSNSELSPIESSNSEPLQFSFETKDLSLKFELQLGQKIVNGNQESYFKIKKITDIPASINYGNKSQNLEDFFQIYTPTFWFADGSQLFQNRYVKLKEHVGHIPLEDIITDTWTGVSLRKESQGVSPYIQDSIQYYFINKIKEDFDIVFDDDGKGEIADIIGINDLDKTIDIHLFHLKYAKGGTVSNNIENFYQVCGQAQKSLNWKYRKGKEFFEHMLRRKEKSENGISCSRIIKGDEDHLESMLNAAKWSKEMKFHIYIGQPGFSKSNVSDNILLLLGNTHHYLHTVGNVELKVYSSN